MTAATPPDPGTSPAGSVGRPRLLLTGWFSYPEGGGTAGDIVAAQLASRWLADAGVAHEVCVGRPFHRGEGWVAVDPTRYDQVVFVCGPFNDLGHEHAYLDHFARPRRIGLNVSVAQDDPAWQPFDAVVPRDSEREENPDIVFGAGRRARVPVVGVCLVEPDAAADHTTAHAQVQRLLSARELAPVLIDTRLDINTTGLRTAAEVESLIARMDVVVTTRLHGMVFALSNGVPAIAIDTTAGAAKLVRQARAIGWPYAFTLGSVTDAELERALEECLGERARALAARCADAAADRVSAQRDRFLAAVVPAGTPTDADALPVEALRIERPIGARLALDTYPYGYRSEIPPPSTLDRLGAAVRRRAPEVVRRPLGALWQRARRIVEARR